ncbi:MAG: molybdopterin cofactor-binding domain-containing protein [Sphingorhabdus sp.]
MSETGGIEISRRNLLIGGGVGVGLLVAWAVWPRRYMPNLVAEKGEHIFGHWLKIGEDGRVTIAIPQAEMGQGSYTALAQIVAGELGADWRTVAVQPALPSPVFANELFVREWRSAFMPARLGLISRNPDIDGITDEWATRNAYGITAGSTSIRQFERPCRIAGAAACSLLCMVAAERWDTEWENCEAEGGFVTFEKKKIPFAELAAQAAKLEPPSPVPLRAFAKNGISGQEAIRLDVAAKVDGSANFAGDVRLPDMLFASVRAGPIGDNRLKEIERDGAKSIPGLVDIVRTEHWVAALAANWWAANKALDAIAPTFATTGPMPDSGEMTAAMERALDKGPGSRFVDIGSVDASLEKAAGTRIFRSQFSVQPALHAPLETRSATAEFRNGRLTLWLATQAPEAARTAAAKAIGVAENAVTLIPMQAGGSFGRNLDQQIAGQVAVLAKHMGRPVQVVWSRPEDFIRDHVRPPALARMTASLDVAGRIAGLAVRIAVPAVAREQIARLSGETPAEALRSTAGEHDPLAIDGAMPPYAIPNLTIDHFPVSLPLPAGLWRGNAHSYTAFFVESFVNELAAAAGIEPLSYRMQMLVGQTRLARCLTGVAALAGWDGGAGASGKGIACHSMYGSHIAVIATARTDESGVRVDRISACVDCGRLINPELARQQIEGGIIFGLAQALGSATDYENGLPVARRFRDLDLPLLSDIPEIEVEFLRNEEEPGGVSELGVAAVAPAISNALFSAAGIKLRELPLLSRGL